MTTTTTSSTNSAPTGTAGRTNTVATNAVLAGFRIVAGFLFLCHGLQGFGAFGGIDTQGTAVAFLEWPGWWGSLIELVGGALVALGLCTRPAAVLCSGAMAYAYFVVHQPTALFPLQNMGEPAALYSWIFLLIAVLGPGRYALDTLLRRRREPAAGTGS
ncbi:DoxX family protein [Amycolatopsis aidingensis]|uniref:DoxX family protein n=1 Tax=Amycolatopsis aidingensis TaxID=2842453 RepID=UPI001C0B34EC|nr:DoxX family protein [Amycolatopsis aidingensis]